MRRIENYSKESIQELLICGGLNSAEAGLRAPMVKEDLEWIGFKEFWLNPTSHHQVMPYCIPEYYFGDTGCNINSAEHADSLKVEWMGGTGIECGHLQFFTIVSKIARQLIPQYWLKPCKLRKLLKSPTQHLDTLEEIWWLARWQSPQNIKSAVRLKHESARDVDWTFTVGDGALNVNLEVKRLIGDCVRHVTERSFKVDWFEEFCEKKVIPKFRASRDNEVNVLCISLFGEITGEVQLAVSEWLMNRQNLIDAVFIASREARRKSGFDVQLRNGKARLMKNFLNEPSLEDQSLAYYLKVPVKIPGIPSIVKP